MVTSQDCTRESGSSVGMIKEASICSLVSDTHLMLFLLVLLLQYDSFVFGIDSSKCCVTCQIVDI